MQPNSIARVFIIDAKLSILPAICIAKTLAASLEEGSNKAYSKSFIVNSSPIFNKSVEYPDGTEVIASDVTVAISFKSQFSNVSNAVMIFVVLAGSRFSFADFSYKTFPVSPSIKIADSALIFKLLLSAKVLTGSRIDKPKIQAIKHKINFLNFIFLLLYKNIYIIYYISTNFNLFLLN